MAKKGILSKKDIVSTRLLIRKFRNDITEIFKNEESCCSDNLSKSYYIMGTNLSAKKMNAIKDILGF